MTRRPCSITLTSDDSTILCADKFGDVYSLPLIPRPDYVIPEAPVEPVQEEEWIPSATVLTVHSGRNRKTLEDQLKQKKKGPAPPKDEMKFEHQLLLGHVSMLTDIVNAEVDARHYIITADRDEHIRVSRGIPQAHIIEGFCFGHEAFISKLCLSNSGRLVSGGGDQNLFVWDWSNYKLLKKLPLLDAVAEHLKSRPELDAGEVSKVAVSGIWSVPHQDEVLVACEGVPALFSFKIDKQGHPHNGVQQCDSTQRQRAGYHFPANLSHCLCGSGLDRSRAQARLHQGSARRKGKTHAQEPHGQLD
jgi:tRNA (guanine-N(7)-)-methyltransferase subunit TRM82